jgi:hypothetical protein
VTLPLPGWTGVDPCERLVPLFCVVPPPPAVPEPWRAYRPDEFELAVAGEVFEALDGVAEYTTAAATPAAARLPMPTAAVMPLASRLPLSRVSTGVPFLCG